MINDSVRSAAAAFRSAVVASGTEADFAGEQSNVTTVSDAFRTVTQTSQKYHFSLICGRQSELLQGDLNARQSKSTVLALTVSRTYLIGQDTILA